MKIIAIVAVYPKGLYDICRALEDLALTARFCLLGLLGMFQENTCNFCEGAGQVRRDSPGVHYGECPECEGRPVHPCYGCCEREPLAVYSGGDTEADLLLCSECWFDWLHIARVDLKEDPDVFEDGFTRWVLPVLEVFN